MGQYNEQIVPGQSTPANISANTSAQGKMAAVDEAMTEVLRLALVHGPRLFMASALEGLASMMAQTQKHTSAVRLLSAASALRTQMGTPVRLVDKPMLEQTYATLRAALTEDVFESIWAEAQLLTLDEIVSGLLANRMQ
mgnify:CR=1 FL=1